MIKIYFLKELRAQIRVDLRFQLNIDVHILQKEEKDDFDLDFRRIDGDAIAGEVIWVLVVGYGGEGGDDFCSGLDTSEKGRDENAIESER